MGNYGEWNIFILYLFLINAENTIFAFSEFFFSILHALIIWGPQFGDFCGILSLKKLCAQGDIKYKYETLV